MLPDLAGIMRAEIAHLLRRLDERRSKECDVHYLSRCYALDVTRESITAFIFPLTPVFEVPMNAVVIVRPCEADDSRAHI